MEKHKYKRLLSAAKIMLLAREKKHSGDADYKELKELAWRELEEAVKDIEDGN